MVCVYDLRSMSTKNIGKTTQMFVFASETKSMKHLIISDIVYALVHNWTATIHQKHMLFGNNQYFPTNSSYRTNACCINCNCILCQKYLLSKWNVFGCLKCQFIVTSVPSNISKPCWISVLFEHVLSWMLSN